MTNNTYHTYGQMKKAKKASFSFLLTWFTIHCSLFTVHAQEVKTDSLWNIWIDETQADTTRLKAIHTIGLNGNSTLQPDSAFYYSQMEYNFAKAKALKKQMADALSTQGSSFYHKNDFIQARQYHNRSLELSEEIADKKGIAFSQINIGYTFRKKGDYTKAIEHYQKGLKIREESGDKNEIAKAVSSIGLMYDLQGDYPKALDYYQRSLKILEDLGDKLGIARAISSIGLMYDFQGDYPKALDYYQRSLKICEEMGHEWGISMNLNNIGLIYDNQKDYSKALDYYQRSLKISEEDGDKDDRAIALSNIGEIYSNQENYEQAFSYFERSLKISEEIGDRLKMTHPLRGIGNAYRKQGQYKKAISQCLRSLKISEEMGATFEQKGACECLYESYKALGLGSKALDYYEQMIVLKDSLFNEENTKKLTRIELQYEYDKKEAASKLEQEKKDVLATEELRRNKLIRNVFMGGFAVVLLFAVAFLSQRNKIKKSKKQSDDLLLNILPAEVAEELKAKGQTEAKHYNQASILFTDFKGFTNAAETLSPKELVDEINICFIAFDHICEKYNIEKIKTIGDAYMAASGLFDQGTKTQISQANLIKGALEMQAFMITRSKELEFKDITGFQMRAGIHTGPVVAGIVGIKKFQYDIWGDSVNTASRMESHGEVGRVNISEATYRLLKDESDFTFESRGKIEAKGKGKMEMYFVSFKTDKF
jgi:adenylate cyclase